MSEVGTCRKAASQSRSGYRLPAGRPVRLFTVALVLLGLASWLGCGGAVEPVPGPAVEVQVTPAGMSSPGVGSTVVAVDASTFSETRPAGASVAPDVRDALRGGLASDLALIPETGVDTVHPRARQKAHPQHFRPLSLDRLSNAERRP